MVSSLVFGPVPSRRLGRSLGINNIPPKRCSYSCVYCQIGKTSRMLPERMFFYDPQEIANSVKERIETAREKGESIDYLSFVPDGEPTLDINLGTEIELLKSFGFKIAAITNASFIWRKDVRQDLKKADWVSLKVDAISSDIWHRLDRPHRLLNINKIMEGMLTFRSKFSGILATESMFIQGFNDDIEEITAIADFLAKLKPEIAYLSIPSRPPAVKTVTAASEKTINMAYQIFKQKSVKAECLIGHEGNAFALIGNIEDELLSITAVHPMRVDAVMELLKKADAGWKIIERLIRDGKLIEVDYLETKFYVRKW